MLLLLQGEVLGISLGLEVQLQQKQQHSVTAAAPEQPCSQLLHPSSLTDIICTQEASSHPGRSETQPSHIAVWGAEAATELEQSGRTSRSSDPCSAVSRLANHAGNLHPRHISPGPRDDVTEQKALNEKQLQQQYPQLSIHARARRPSSPDVSGAPSSARNPHHTHNITANSSIHHHHHHHHHHPHKAGGLSHGSGSCSMRKAQQLMRSLAPWLVLGVCGFALLVCITRPAGAAKTEDIQLDLGPYFFNPSIVKHHGVYLSTARTAHMKRIDRTNWWFNEGYICMSTASDFKSVSCRKFDPWQG